ncbi:MAG: aspartate carbamoyltransferase regulatory subunit [Bacteroidales bacterium]|nr:aspartate carbamoyltransferase regulatory subunit [Bacteroidales bacterium]
MKDKILEVSAIKDGTVIDHVPADSLFKVISILGLDKIDKKTTFGTNLESHRLGKKAIIKLSDIQFKKDEINKISLVAPQAKLNIIKDYQVVEKKVVEIPDDVIGIVKCVNPQCITNNERITTKFKVISKSEVKLKCHYCEKITDREHMEII